MSENRKEKGVQRGGAKRSLSSAAKRALGEAAKRRVVLKKEDSKRPKEFQGRNGPDPARYGDWENKGIASDF